MPMQNLLLLAELKALGVCPCRMYYFWQNWRHWVCAHAELITFGKPWGHWACAHAEFITFGELKALGACPCKTYYFWQN